MKLFHFRIIIFIVLFYSCTKEPEKDGAKDYYFKGVVYSSTGTPLPNIIVYYYGEPGPIITYPGYFPCYTWYNIAYSTDQNGEFAGKIFIDVSCHYEPCTKNHYLFVINNLEAGFVSFKNYELHANTFIQRDIHLAPIGYLKMKLIDTSFAQTAQVSISCNTIDSTRSWTYDAQSQNFADTTFVISMFPNTYANYWINTSNLNLSDSIYIPSNDTILKTIYY
jgi:hypothetical protein